MLRKSADTTGGGGFGIGRLSVRDVSVSAELAPDSVAHARVQQFLARDLAVGDTTLVRIDALELGIQPPRSSRWLGLATRGGVTANEIRLDPLRVHSDRAISQAAWSCRGASATPGWWTGSTSGSPPGRSIWRTSRSRAWVPASGLLRFDARAKGDGDLVTAHLAASLDRGR